jgi:hypothetical protein
VSAEAAGLQHAELEEQLEVRGRELLRRVFQDRLDATAAAEERRHDVTGEDEVVRDSGAEAAKEESAGSEAEGQGKAAGAAGKGQVADRLGHR